MHYFGVNSMMGVPMLSPVVGLGLVALILWSLVWKGLALWRAAKRGEKVWFVVFMILNTAGLLEIFYLFFVTGAKLSDFSSTSSHEHHGSKN